MIRSPLYIVFSAAMIALFVGFVSAIIWLDKVSTYLSNMFADFGGLFGQLALWAVGIALAMFLLLRLVALVLRSGRPQQDR